MQLTEDESGDGRDRERKHYDAPNSHSLVSLRRFKGTQITLGLHHLWKTLIVSPTIKHVNLESTHLKEEDVRIAHEALKHPNCVLESLR